MSWRASQWAVGQVAGSGPAKSVLMVLAEAADQDGASFLSHETIAARAELSVRAVWAQMKALEQRGLVARKRRYDSRGHRTSDLVVLSLSQAAGDAVRGEGLAAPDAARRAPPTRTSCTPYPHVVHSLPARGAEEPVSEPVSEPVLSLTGEAPARRRPSSSEPKGMRLPQDWAPPDDAYEFGGALGLTTADVEFEVSKFRDYWRSQPGVRGRKLDWGATWRNWLRRAAEDKARRMAPRTSGRSATDWIFEGS